MRLALLSDIHGNLPALEAVWAEIQQVGATYVLNLGDIASGPLWPQETVAWLRAREAADPGRWRTIAGNHERQLRGDPARMSASDAFAARALAPAESAWLADLPPGRWLGEDVLLCHGTPAEDLTYFLETVEPGWTRGGFPGVRAATLEEVRQRAAQPPAAGRAPSGASPSLVVCGHTHVPRAMALPGGPLVVNPGSVGLPGFDDARPWPHVVETGLPHARWALVERDSRDPARWHVQLRATVYDWSAAAARAEANGRGDWANALATGYMDRFEGGGAAPGA